MSLSDIDCVNGENLIRDWHESALQTRENSNRFCEWNQKVEREKEFMIMKFVDFSRQS